MSCQPRQRGWLYCPLGSELQSVSINSFDSSKSLEWCSKVPLHMTKRQNAEAGRACPGIAASSGKLGNLNNGDTASQAVGVDLLAVYQHLRRGYGGIAPECAAAAASDAAGSCLLVCRIKMWQCVACRRVNQHMIVFAEGGSGRTLQEALLGMARLTSRLQLRLPELLPSRWQ